MSTDLVQINPQEFGIDSKQEAELLSNLPQIIEERVALMAQYDDIVKMDIELPQTAKAAKDLRKRIKDNRTKGIEVWHKGAKEYFLRGGQFVDAVKRKEVAVNVRMEDNLEEIEQYVAKKEALRKDALHNERVAMVLEYVDSADGYDFRDMQEDVFQAFLSAKKKAYEDRIEAERKAEEERQAEAKRLEEEREAQRLENERLKKEAEIREAQIKKEREEAEAKQKSIEEAARKEREEAERKLQAEREKAEAERKERERIEAELQEKKDAELKAEQQRKAEEERAKKEADKAAKAPVKKQLTVWANSFKLPEGPNHEVADEIKKKFEAFQLWALKQIESI